MTRSVRVRHAAVLVGVLVVGVLCGAALRGWGSSRGPAPAAPTPVPTGQDEDDGGGELDLAGPGPSSSVAGVGVGFERSEQGALAAAMSYGSATQSWLYLSDDDLEEAIEAVVVSRAREQLVAPMADEIRLLRQELGEAAGTVWFVVSPMATKLESYSDARAVVRVWTVRVLSAEGVAVPQSGWATLTLELEWDSDDWRVAGVGEVAGPVPQLEAGLEPWSAGSLDDGLAGFLRVGVL